MPSNFPESNAIMDVDTYSGVIFGILKYISFDTLLLYYEVHYFSYIGL